MRTIAFIAVVLGVALAQGPGRKDYCDEVRFQGCTQQLASFWGFGRLNIWDSPYYLAETVNSLLKAPYAIQNMINVCNGLSLFNQCLGKSQVGICLGPIGWVGRGRAPNTAFAFDGMLMSLSFQCGAGIQSIERSPNMSICLQSTTVNYDPEITKFYTSYELNIAHDPKSACDYAQTLTNGVASIYQTGPCRTVNKYHAEWFACEMTRNYVFSQFKHCQHLIRCPKIASDFSAVVREGESGKHEFLLPATWRKDTQGDWNLEAEKWI